MADGDNKIEKHELLAFLMMEHEIRIAFQCGDSDGDNTLSRKEFQVLLDSKVELNVYAGVCGLKAGACELPRTRPFEYCCAAGR